MALDELVAEMESHNFGPVHLSDRLQSLAHGQALIVVKA